MCIYVYDNLKKRGRERGGGGVRREADNLRPSLRGEAPVVPYI